jgi:hypothetical protein
MYIELIHDAAGDVKHCWCADTLPKDSERPMFKLSGTLPASWVQVRINTDTITDMEIKAQAGKGGGARYVKDTFTVNTTKNITVPASVRLPPDMKMRELKRKP